jgi:hypothetical protein
MNWEDRMRFAKLASIGSGALILTLSTVTTGAQAHDDDYGWKRKHHHHHLPRPSVYVIRERPVYYYSEPRLLYAPPPGAYYRPGPPSLNINIPLR